jgi:hypothetical protein
MSELSELQHIGEDLLLDLTDCGDIVVDPFLGSGWGSAHRALPPVRVAGAPMGWTRPASRLGSAPAAWGA